MNDEGVSELLGYAILAGMAITAVICVGSGAAGAIFSSADSASLSEAALAMKSLAATAMSAAYQNNTYFTTSQVQVPSGYELFTLDSDDDYARLTIRSGDRELFSVREGSIRLRSPFRSVSFEGGAVFVNDSGIIDIIRKPSVFTVTREGDTSLYVYLIGISADSGVISGSSPVVFDVRAESQHNISLPLEGPVTISLSSAAPGGWAAILRDEGFTVACNGCAVTATKGAISDVFINCATLRVRIE